MTILGWLVLLVSVGGTTGFFIFCMSRVLRGGEDKNLHGFEIQTPDEKADRAERRR